MNMSKRSIIGVSGRHCAANEIGPRSIAESAKPINWTIDSNVSGLVGIAGRLQPGRDTHVGFVRIVAVANSNLIIVGVKFLAYDYEHTIGGVRERVAFVPKLVAVTALALDSNPGVAIFGHAFAPNAFVRDSMRDDKIVEDITARSSTHAD